MSFKPTTTWRPVVLGRLHANPWSLFLRPEANLEKIFASWVWASRVSHKIDDPTHVKREKAHLGSAREVSLQMRFLGGRPCKLGDTN